MLISPQFKSGWVFGLLLSMVLTGCQKPSQQALSVPGKAQPMLAKGQQIFESSCAGCHSVTGHGNKMMSASMPDFTTMQWQHRLSDQAIIKTVKAGKGMMPPFDNQFSPIELKALVAYIRHFQEGSQ